MRVIVNLNNGKIECDAESLLHFTLFIVVPFMENFVKHFEQDPVYKKYKKMFKQGQIELQRM